MTPSTSSPVAVDAMAGTTPEAADIVERLRYTASKGISVWGDLQIEAADTIQSLRARVAELEQDAARYRWLRDGDWRPFDYEWLRDIDAIGMGSNYEEVLDAAIDSAMNG
jgi:hypothetical protein